MNPVLDLARVTLVIDEQSVLHPLDWVVHADERWVIVGANGAGKTSLLQIASLHRHPSTGTVTCLGETLGRCDLRALRQRTALSSPALAARLEPTMDALEVVMTARYGALAPWWHRYDADDRARAQELLDHFGVGRFAARTLDTLSAGERQKVLLARTLMRAPEIVFLDEPTSGLDIGAREQVLADLDRVADGDGPALVVVTHHLEEVPASFTHALVLHSGRAIGHGPIDGVLTSELLSDAYGVPLTVERDASGRFSARLAR